MSHCTRHPADCTLSPVGDGPELAAPLISSIWPHVRSAFWPLVTSLLISIILWQHASISELKRELEAAHSTPDAQKQSTEQSMQDPAGVSAGQPDAISAPTTQRDEPLPAHTVAQNESDVLEMQSQPPSSTPGQPDAISVSTVERDEQMAASTGAKDELDVLEMTHGQPPQHIAQPTVPGKTKNQRHHTNADRRKQHDAELLVRYRPDLVYIYDAAAQQKLGMGARLINTALGEAWKKVYGVEWVNNSPPDTELIRRELQRLRAKW